MIDIRQTETYRTARENRETLKFWHALAVAFSVPGDPATSAVIRTHDRADFVVALNTMVDGYLEALLWTAVTNESSYNGGDENYLDAGYAVSDVSERLRSAVTDHLLSVVVAHPLAVRLYGARRTFRALGPNTVARSGEWNYFGHDYLLTRDGHGAGFWDRGLGELGDYLTDVAQSNGGSEFANGGLYVTADGQVDA